MKSIVLITGANGLLGCNIIKHLSQSNQYCIYATDQDKSLLQTDAKNLNYFPLNLTSHDAIEIVLKHISKALEFNSHLSVIHLAAIDQKDVMDANPLPHKEEFSKILNSFNVNSFVSLKLMQSLTNLVLEKNVAMSFVYVPSLYCYHSPNPNLYGEYDEQDLPIRQKSLAYVTSKAGIISAIKLFASTYARRKLRFNCLVPHGVINNVNEDFAKKFSLYSPIGRTSLPSDLFPAVEFLIDPKNLYYNGQSLFIDGGWSTV